MDGSLHIVSQKKLKKVEDSFKIELEEIAIKWYIYLLIYIALCGIMGSYMKKRSAYLEDQIREAFKESGMTVYRLAKNSGVPQPVVSRFINRKRGITLDTASKLVTILGLELIQTKKRRKAR
jgi:hypothetical protein